MADSLLLVAVACLALTHALGWWLRRSYRRSLAASLDGWSRTVDLLVDAVRVLAALERDLADLRRRYSLLCDRVTAQSDLLPRRAEEKECRDEL